MKLQCSTRKVLAAAFLCGAWLWGQPTEVWAQAGVSGNGASQGAFTMGKLNGVFTVEDFQSANGVSVAAGWLTATVTDPYGTNQLGAFTNMAVRMPISGILSGDPIMLGVGDPVTLPSLSTNTCSILGIVVGAIDVVVPGLGLDVHVNEISLVVQSDRNTTIGNLLCNILGGGGVLGLTNLVAGYTGSGSGPAGSAKSSLTVQQAQGLMGILLGPGLPGSLDPNSLQVSTAGAPPSKPNPVLGLQNVLQRFVTTMSPSIPPVPAPSPQSNKAKTSTSAN